MKKKIPSSGKAWLIEIWKAYNDAEEAIAFGPVAGVSITENDLFHMAPSVCIKFRGLKRSEKNLKMATDAALSSYAATKELKDGITNNPFISFAFCYIASHYGLGLLLENEANDIIQYLEENQSQLKRWISK
jgi:hypothetical protein